MAVKNIDISIITINYNSTGYTIRCIESILQNTTKTLNYEVLVVDNASELKDLQTLEQGIKSLNNSRIKLLKSRINTGFGGGNMFGVQHAQGRYYVFLNNDTLLIDDPIHRCYEFMERSTHVAISGPQIYDENHKTTISFDYFTSFAREVFGRELVSFLWKKPKRRFDYKEPIEIDYVNGSFMFTRAEDFNSVGGFDTNIFLYFEESDLCHRLKKIGKPTYFLPSASYLHFQDRSVRKNTTSIAKKIELKTSMFYVIRKNYGYFHYQVLRMVFIFRYGCTSLVKPKYFALFKHILIGLPIGKSLKHQQAIKN
ncbi:glycosyltransferase family 2 protein [Flagellimonas eckloniae]|uniref:Glycosyltransferase 2-like domain-containing protein n=1 Tax=Flagellimonas eckloniae TaxID=346185 RepID=A0A0Q1CCW5_9FLAO|nr:glycosyltransferase family 2 protein [Allomuricauda eckloniae]KQC28500.1 hypothetical protein AAY42_00250 [Allomuricauda eckloniae]